MKRVWKNGILLLAAITGVLSTPVICHAGEVEKQLQTVAEEEKSDLIAGKDEKAASKPVGEEGMTVVHGSDIRDGVYEIEVDSSSSMFRVVKAELTVTDGNMTAVLTLGGKGYLKVYMGTGEEAVEADEAEYIPYVEDAQGAYTYTVPVEVLNQELECTAFSKRKEKWYDRQLVFLASSLPEDALLIELNPKPQPVQFSVEDGNYTMEVSLAGGSGRATVVSPAMITVSNQTGIARIEWSSANYDYMLVNGEKYLPVNKEGNSVFEIPVLALDEEMDIIADTVAMSKPHEVAYTLTFDSNTLAATTGVSAFTIAVIAGGACIVAAGVVIWICRGKKSHDAQRKEK